MCRCRAGAAAAAGWAGGALASEPPTRLALTPFTACSGEDLTPFRAASKAIHAVLRRFGPAEKLGLDETWLDVTAEAQRRLAALEGLPPAALAPQLAWRGHVHRGGTALAAESRHRPMDLRVARSAVSGCQTAAAGPGAAGRPPQPPWPPPAGLAGWEALLALGSAIAAEARAAVRTETGFRCSAGIASNKASVGGGGGGVVCACVRVCGGVCGWVGGWVGGALSCAPMRPYFSLPLHLMRPYFSLPAACEAGKRAAQA